MLWPVRCVVLIGLLLCQRTAANGFKGWKPQPKHAVVPLTEQALAELYLFPSVEEMHHWLLMTEDDIISGRGEDQLEQLMDGRFVCDANKVCVLCKLYPVSSVF
jgi:hypothetical protein